MRNPVRRWPLAPLPLVRQWWDAARGWQLPGQCLACRQWCRGHWCSACRRTIGTDDRPRCFTCALALPMGAGPGSRAPGPGQCGRCLRHRPPLQRCVAAADYGFPWDQWLLGLKFRARLELAPLLGEVLGAALARAHFPGPVRWPDLVVPVPLSASRLRERGFNQSLEIARHLPGRRQYRLCAHTLVRVRHTGRQSDLPLADRRANLHRAFAVVRPVQGLHVALVDDVMTSGATLHEAATVLQRAGAATVQAWVVARTP